MEYLLSLLFLALATGLQAAYIAELTDDNFYEYVKDKSVVMVEFYAPWCSDCKNLEPEVQKAADTLERRSGDLVKVDCFGSGKGLCDMYRVKSWPQLKLFNKGNYIGDYTGAQSGDALALYVESLAGNYETKSVPAPMDAFAAGQQVPYQAASQPAPVAAAPISAPVAPIPATPQQFQQQPQKAVTPENSGIKVEAHAKAIIHKEKDAKKNLNEHAKEKLKKVIKEAKKIGKSIKKKIRKIVTKKDKKSAKGSKDVKTSKQAFVTTL
eukprot:gene10029-11053_t